MKRALSGKETEPKKFVPPLEESFNNQQIDLFQSFLCNGDGHQEKLSNAIPLWDCLPRYTLSRQTLNKLRKEGKLPPLMNLPCRYFGQNYIVQIQPARIMDDKGGVMEYYPGLTEELIEDALRKIATLQQHGYFDQSEVRSGVSFSIYELREELRRQGHTRSYDEIVLSLKIMARSIIELQTEADRNKAVSVSAYLSHLSSVSRADLKEDPDARWYVEFHHLITQAISAVEYRQYNYTLMMSHSTQLARWLHKYLVNKFTYAQIGKVFEIRFSTVKRDSGLLEAYSRSRDAIDAVNKALEELKQKGVLESIQANRILGGKGKIEDVVYTVFPTITFSMEIKASNKRLSDAKKGIVDDQSPVD